MTGTLPEADEAEVRAGAEGPEVGLEAYLTEGALRLEVLSTLVCRITVRDGLHLYADGAPEAFAPARLTVGGHGIRTGDAAWPEPHRLRMEALDLAVPVWEGGVTVTVPVTATSELVRLGHGLDQEEATVQVRLDFQACDENSCLLPRSVGLELRAPLETLVEPDGIRVYVDRLESQRPASPTERQAGGRGR